MGQPKRYAADEVALIQNGCAIGDFQCCPFRDHVWVTGGQDGSVGEPSRSTRLTPYKIKVWHVDVAAIRGAARPAAVLSTPVTTLKHAAANVDSIAFHPSAEDVRATRLLLQRCQVLCAAGGVTVKVWDIKSGASLFTLDDHPEPMQSITWMDDGDLLLTTCRDRHVRVFDPRVMGHALKVREGGCHC